MVFVGISDGAGGNAMYGYNPRLFSECLMRHCSNLARTGQYSSSDPKSLLCRAFDCVQNDKCYGMFLFRQSISYFKILFKSNR